MKLGILCAVDREAAPFLPWMQGKRIREKAMLKVHEGTIEGVDAAVLFSGVCKVNAAIAAQVLIDAFSCDAIIVSGTAGGIDERLRVYDTVICTEAAYHDVEEGILTQFHPWMDSVYFCADPALAALAMRAAQEADVPGVIYPGRIVTGEQFIEKETYPAIQAQFSPLCVDMETAGVAHVCHVNGIPFAAVRTITDVPREGNEAAFEANLDCAARISAEIVRGMLRLMKEREGFPAEKRHAHVELIRAGLSDAELIWRMQTKAFVPLLERYQDADTNPANEPLMRVRQRLEMKETFYYLIVLGGETVGAVRVVDPQNGQRKRISPLFVLPEHQGKGVAQAALREAERMHGEGNWQLETIAQEAGNCRLYEKMGYRRTGEQTVINEQMTLITYEK